MKQRNRNKWAKRANELIESLGAVAVDEHYPWCLTTKAGPLFLRVEANPLRNHGPGTVFTRFACPPAAKVVVDCNPHSGKWNHHYCKQWTGPQALDDLKLLLENIICR